MRQRRHVRGRDGKSPTGDCRNRGLRCLAYDSGGRIDGEVFARIDRACSDHRHDGDAALKDHRAITDGPCVRLTRHHLGRGAGGNQRVKARDSATRDGNEAERKNLSREYGPVAIHKARQRGHLQLGTDDQYPDRQHSDYAELDEGAEVIPRRQ